MDAGYAALFTTPDMARVFAPEAHVARMLAVEAALAHAEAEAGVIPQAAADAIAPACRVELYDVAAVYREAETAGTAAIPLVRMLTEQVDEVGQGYVHWGATSQDIIDSAFMLQMRDGLDLLIADLLGLGAACAALAEAHRTTLMAGRTLLQHALPIPFGLKAARWLALVTRQVRALRAGRNEAVALQFGGAVGTLAALGDAGLTVAALLAEELGLPLADLPWHAERDRVAVIATSLGVVAGSMAKIATDLSLLAQTEVAEAQAAAESGKGGSSAMPHKRNPVDAVQATAAARLAIGVVPVVLNAMTHEHERAVGGWQAEWVALPTLFGYTASAVAHVRQAVADLEVDAARMRANLEVTRGLIMAEALVMALAPRIGRPEAMRLVKAVTQRAQEASLPLREAALSDPQLGVHLAPDAIQRTLDPNTYLGSAELFIDRALAAYHMSASA